MINRDLHQFSVGLSRCRLRKIRPALLPTTGICIDILADALWSKEAAVGQTVVLARPCGLAGNVLLAFCTDGKKGGFK